MSTIFLVIFFFSSRRRHTRWPRDWSSDVCSSDLIRGPRARYGARSRPADARAKRHLLLDLKVEPAFVFRQLQHAGSSDRRRVLFRICRQQTAVAADESHADARFFAETRRHVVARAIDA